MSSTQKLTPPQRGVRVTADRESKIVTQLRRLIRGGPGVSVQAAGDQVVISAKRGPITPRTTGGTGGSANDYHYIEATKAELPDASGVSPAAFGRVDGEGSDNGMVCVPNPAKNGWDALNFWE